MVWEHVEAEVTRPHIAYATTGFALLLFGTLSLFLKERLYIGEATVATIYGLIVGPHCLNWFSPTTWGNTDYITLELSRIVLIVQIFAVAVELPKKYMLRHWWSVTMLLVPVMTYGWVISSVFIWKLIPSLRWIEALAIAGCVTATDPVLASAVVGKGKFARRVPGHLRNILSAESGCNDGMAYPFVALAVTILQYEGRPGKIAKEFIGVIVFYQCVLGILVGVVIGYLARHLIKFAEQRDLIDRESFLVYYFCVALFCAGVGTLTGTDDLLVAFSAGAAFSWDGWFAKQTENAHVSNVIDILMNTAFFVYFGAVVPWPDFNNADLGIRAWKLVIIAIIILFVRRLPIMLALKPVIPDIKTWREAFFCGHFGPIGVGGLFMAILARAMLENNSETPTRLMPPVDSSHYMVIRTIWPVTCFLVVASIIVHGSSIAVFTLGKRLNNIAITMSYTTGGNNPSWMSRLPTRMGHDSSGNPLRLQKIDTEMPLGQRLRKRNNKKTKTEEAPAASTSGASSVTQGSHGRRQSKIPLQLKLDLGSEGKIDQTDMVPAEAFSGMEPDAVRAYREGPNVVVEDESGNVVHNFDIGDRHGDVEGTPHITIHKEGQTNPESTGAGGPESRRTHRRTRSSATSRLPRAASVVDIPHLGEHVYAYQVDDEVIVEDEEGDVIRRYRYMPRGSPNQEHNGHAGSWWRSALGAFGVKRYGHSQQAFPRSTTQATTTTASQDSDEKYRSVSNSPDYPGPVPESSGDVEHAPHSTLVPLPNEETGSDALDPHMTLSNRDEAHVRQQIESMLKSGQLSRRGSRSEGAAPADDFNSVDIDENAVDTQTDAEAEEHYEGDDDDEPPETEVERARRLAALGVISNGDDDDQNVIEAPAPAARRQQEDEDDEPRITFRLPKRH